jgi:putative ABC transport system permease protein
MDLTRDLRYALRTLRASPAFTATAVLTLALAIAANTVVLSVLDRVLIRPLPFGDRGELVTVFEQNDRGDRRLASYPTFLDWTAATRSFSAIAFARGTTGILQTGEGPERLAVAFVSRDFFSALQVQPEAGRTFTADEDQPAAADVVVLSYRLWRQRFGGDRSIIGRDITLDRRSVTVVGVVPRGARYPLWADAFRPISAVVASDPALTNRAVRADSRIIARLRPGVSTEAGVAELAVIQSRLAAEYPESRGTGPWRSVALDPLRNEIVGDARSPILMVSAAVMLVLLIACSNVANLSLARASSRARELAVRVALGASRGRIARQILTESAVIGLGAGGIGVLLAAWVLGLIRSTAPANLPRADELTIDPRVLGLTLALSLVATLLFGLVPAFRRETDSLPDALRDSRQGTSGGRRAGRVRGVLATAQVAIAVMLLIGAGLLIESFRRVREVDLGFDPENVILLRIWPPSPKYDAPEAAAALYGRVLEAVRAVPGVSHAAVVNHAPLSGGGIPTRIVVPGQQDATGDGGALYMTASADFPATVGARVIHGRWFTDAEIAAPGDGIVISNAVAQRHWPGENPLGKPMTVFRSSQARPNFGAPIQTRVIGVIADIHHFGSDREPTPLVYVPYTVEPWPHIALLVRTSIDPERVIPALRSAVLDVDYFIPVLGSTPSNGFTLLTSALSEDLSTRRYSTGVVMAFGACALLLAITGIYGLLAYSVAQRTREVGVRLALGASPQNVLRMVVGQGLRLAVIGTGLGVAGALALTRLLASLLYETSPTDPVIFVAVSAIVVLTAVAASLIPAARAAWLDPSIALRTD